MSERKKARKVRKKLKWVKNSMNESLQKRKYPLFI